MGLHLVPNPKDCLNNKGKVGGKLLGVGCWQNEKSKCNIVEVDVD
jgi:hypothetical protein